MKNIRDGFESVTRIWVLLILLCLSGQGRCETVAYTVGGRLEHRTFLGQQVQVSTNRFEVEVWNCTFINRADDIYLKPYRNARAPSKVEHFSDGKGAFIVNWIAEVGDPGVKKRKDGRFVIKDASGRSTLLPHNTIVSVCPEVFPPNANRQLVPPWFTYAAQCVLSTNGAGDIFPLTFVGGKSWPGFGGIKVPASWVCSDKPPYVIEKLVESSSPELLEAVRFNFEARSLGAIPTVYEKGFTNAIYEVLHWTNYGNLKIPSHFKLTRYVPKVNGVSNQDLDVHYTDEGFVDSVGSGPSGAIHLPEEAPSWSKIQDFNQASAKGSEQYIEKDGKILSSEELEKRKSWPKRKRAIIWGALIGITTFSLVFLVAVKRRSAGGK